MSARTDCPEDCPAPRRKSSSKSHFPPRARISANVIVRSAGNTAPWPRLPLVLRLRPVSMSGRAAYVVYYIVVCPRGAIAEATDCIRDSTQHTSPAGLIIGNHA